MSVLLSFDLDERRALAAGALSPLARALRAELTPLVDGRLPIPEQKARLTRDGGRCSFDGTLLAFDPWSPREHKCPQCHRVFAGVAHDDWWAMGAQLWVAERAVQAAALSALTGEQAMSVLAHRILSELADRYETWPNKDNALGSTRPFFSTYLESIWLLNLCHAIALLEQQRGADTSTLNRVRSMLVLPSRNLIASFHEGRSNRQVWNEVAILSASRILGDHGTFHTRLTGEHGLYDLFADGLLDDGTWYEGENYHLFAHRGLWYGVQLLRAAGVPLPEHLERKFRAGFVTPFLGVLPDDTLPSRRDSQYKVSIRQWRFAEWCEVGIAHAQGSNSQPDERLVGTLHRLYHPSHADGLQAQQRHPFSTADAERNEPAGLLSRADLSWRSLLMMTATLPESDSWSPGSVCLPAQGLAVIRRDGGQTYIALEGGHTGGGHGHPDRLALTVQRGHDRWLEDPGTGSYVEQQLHWYRSTLAHAAPLVDGASQDAVPAKLLAFEDRGGAGWMCKRVEGVKPGVNMQRTIVVCDGYFIDLLEWDADRAVQIDLPLSRSSDLLDRGQWQPADPAGAGGLEDGFDFLRDVAVHSDSIDGIAPSDERMRNRTIMFTLDTVPQAVVMYAVSSPAEIWRAQAPGSPGQEPGSLHWIRMRGSSGCIAGLWSWVGGNWSFSISGDKWESVTVQGRDTQATHTRTDLGWHIALEARHATSSIDLSYLSQPEAVGKAITESRDHSHIPHPKRSSRASMIHDVEIIPHNALLPAERRGIVFTLDERHYRQTEQTWAQAGKPCATITIGILGDVLEIRILAFTGKIVVPEMHDENTLDNERRDVNSDGVELFIGPHTAAPWSASWLVVPAPDATTVAEPGRARTTPTTAGAPALHASWTMAPSAGVTAAYLMQLRLPLRELPVQPDGTFVMELIVNERPADRARRRGQLVLSGGGGFAYLRGDRADPADALTFRVPGTTRNHRL